MDKYNTFVEIVDYIKHRKKLFTILSVAVLILLIILISVSVEKNTNAERKSTYYSAMEYLRNGNVDKAKELFASLPSDYCVSEYALTASEWNDEIDKRYNCSFLGFWGTNYYSFEITQWINVYGIHIDYRTEVKDGILIYEGYLEISSPTQTTAFLGSSKNEYHYQSNAYNYKLVLIDENTMQVYFKGDLEITLKKKSN